MTDGASSSAAPEGSAARAQSDGTATGIRRFLILLLASLREHALLLAIVAVHLLTTAAMPFVLGRPLHFALPLGPVFEKISTIGFWSFLLATVIGFVAAAIRRRAGGPLRSAWVWLTRFLRADRLWGGLIVMAMLPVFGWSFAYLQACCRCCTRSTGIRSSRPGIAGSTSAGSRGSGCSRCWDIR